MTCRLPHPTSSRHTLSSGKADSGLVTKVNPFYNGQTEETFVKEVMAPHLHAIGYSLVSARLLGNARQRKRRGGIRPWAVVRSDILNHLREDPGCVATTMVDYYALPQGGSEGWPGRAEASRLAFPDRARSGEDALLDDIQREMGGGFNARRFVPHVMMHEFEAMLFSDCRGFALGIGRPDLSLEFQAILDQFSSPEEIDDSPITVPSKRIESLAPGYQKPLLGTLAALEVGLGAILARCPHFRDWLERLEALTVSDDRG